MPVSTVVDPVVTNNNPLKRAMMPVDRPAGVDVATLQKNEAMSSCTGTAHAVAKTAHPRQKIASAPFVERKNNDSPPAQLTKPPIRAKPTMSSSAAANGGASSAGATLDTSYVTTTAPVFGGVSPVKVLKPPVRPTANEKDAFAARKAMLDADASDKVACFIATTEGHCRKNQVGKVVFDISGMEFPKTVTVQELETYFYGKSYRRACIKAGSDQYDFSQHEPWVVTHKFNSKFLFCTVTMKTFPRTVENVLQHTRGAKFTRGLKIKQAEMEERKRIAEKRRRNKVKERSAMAEAKKRENDEYAIKVANYNSEEDDDFNPLMDDDEKEEIAADNEMEDVEDEVEDPLIAGMESVARKGDSKLNRKTKAEKIDTSTTEPKKIEPFENNPMKMGDTHDNVDAMNMAPDDEVVDVDALPWIAPKKRAPAPSRRSKTKAAATVAEEAPQLGSDDSSGDEDFAPTAAPLDVDASDDGGEGPLENAIESGGADEDSDDDGAPSETPSAEQAHNEDWGIYKKFNEDVYVGPPKPEPIAPVKPENEMNFARIRAKMRAKKRTKQALKKAMEKSARERQVIRQAKEELRAEAERKNRNRQGQGNTNMDDSFWTRGKHDVKLENVRAQVGFGKDVIDDEMKDEEWKNIRNSVTGTKRKRNAKTPRKSRQDRLRRVMGGAATGTTNININISSNPGSSTM